MQAPPSERVRDRGVVIIDVQGQSAIVGRCEMLQRGERMEVRGRGGDWGVQSHYLCHHRDLERWPLHNLAHGR